MDKATKLKQLLGYEITELEKELMPFLELQDDIELTEKEKEYITRQHMVARMARNSLLQGLETQSKNSEADRKEIKQNAQDVFDNIMKATYSTITKKK